MEKHLILSATFLLVGYDALVTLGNEVWTGNTHAVDAENHIWRYDFDGNYLGDFPTNDGIAGTVPRSPTNGNPFQVGDANLDGAVDVTDYNIWHDNRWTVNTAYCSSDFNTSGAIDVRDFNIWFGNKFQSAGDISAVPEPGCAAMLGVVLPLLGMLLQKKAPAREAWRTDVL